MNSRNHMIEVFCNHKQVNDVAQLFVHSVLFFRTQGKFNYKQEGSYSIGALGFEKIDCDFVELTYTRCSSLTLASRVNDKIQEFVVKLHEYNNINPVSFNQSNFKNARTRTLSGIVHSPTIGEISLDKEYRNDASLKSIQDQAHNTASLYVQSSDNAMANDAQNTPLRQRLGSLQTVNRPNASRIRNFSPQRDIAYGGIGSHSGTLTLEFYTRQTGRWPFNDSKVVWESWNLRIVPCSSNHNKHNPPCWKGRATAISQQAASRLTNRRSISQEKQSESKLEDFLSQKLLEIIQAVNSDKCLLPQMPSQQNVNTVFDTTHSDCQPYLYDIMYKINENTFGADGSGLGGMVVADNSSTPSSLKKFILETLAL